MAAKAAEAQQRRQRAGKAQAIGAARVSKRTAAYLAAGDGLGDRQRTSPAAGRDAGAGLGSEALRVRANTLELLGFTVDDATCAVERRVEEASAQGQKALFLLHGHGTGALKRGLRQWLRQSMGARIKGWRPGGEKDGGDAFTVIQLK
jgi:DNA mismatch repair protein MutS2